MKLSFHGANQSVTGSCHLLQYAGKNILVDCGMYQGGSDLVLENEKPFGFDPKSIHYLLLTHAHLDHCGRIPLLVKLGFKGEIITTSATSELARLIMLDSASLQEEEIRYQLRKIKRLGKICKRKLSPLYTILDALNSLDRFGRKVDYDNRIKLAKDIYITFTDAGHILGSASIYIELMENNRQIHRLMFSGDLGYSGRPILRDPAPPPHVDTVVMETTYGDRLHKQLTPSMDELYSVINKTISRGGNVIIPAFALERTQEILYSLRQGIENKKLNNFINVFLDSPMAISATKIFENHPECYDAETLNLLRNTSDPLNFPGLHFTRETAESIAINKISGGAVIMAGSGMCTGGRVRHHLKHNIWRSESSLVFVGFAAKGTLARKIIDGAKQISIFGEKIPVQADIHTIGGFSAHADQSELIAWHAMTGRPKTTFLVHGEQESMEAIAQKLDSVEVKIPKLHQSYKL